MKSVESLWQNFIQTFFFSFHSFSSHIQEKGGRMISNPLSFSFCALDHLHASRQDGEALLQSQLLQRLVQEREVYALVSPLIVLSMGSSISQQTVFLLVLFDVVIVNSQCHYYQQLFCCFTFINHLSISFHYDSAKS